MAIRRRSLLSAAITACPFVLSGQSDDPESAKAVRVTHNEGRLGERHTIGVSTTDFKVLTKDNRGDLFVMEHASTKKGGPPRHLHHNEGEWFYVVEGDYIFEIGSDRFRLNSGDSILGPRGVAHAWAFVGESPGRMLIAFAPANKMEAFFRDNAKRRKDGEYLNEADVYHAYGLELVGPPLSVG